MCGSGRFLLPLLEHGFSIDGVDASDDMLQACRVNGERRGLTPNLYKQFLHQDEPWGGRWVNRSDGGKIVISWLSQYNPTRD
jgi:hypothetical protein